MLIVNCFKFKQSFELGTGTSNPYSSCMTYAFALSLFLFQSATIQNAYVLVLVTSKGSISLYMLQGDAQLALYEHVS